MKRIRINQKQAYRALVSDVLPYELPIPFSNKGFCGFLQRNRVVVRDGQLMSFAAGKDWVKAVLTLLNGAKGEQKTGYSYEILKECGEEEKMRKLTVPHPFTQVKLSFLYKKYKDYLLYLTQRSRFSIRYPYKVAAFQSAQKPFFPEDVKTEKMDDENLPRHFFAYRRYGNISNFYDDYLYQRAEKKFNYLVRIDIRHCFDNIRPSILFRAVYGEGAKAMKTGLVAEFCRLQMEILPRRTKEEMKGIAIGPEFSRIYAEIVLQSVDVELKKMLEDAGKRPEVDFAFYRYVDDGFFFCNELPLVRVFPDLYQGILKKWELEINRSKMEYYYAKPFISPIAMAKIELCALVDRMFSFRPETVEELNRKRRDNYNLFLSCIGSREAIRNLQSIVGEHGCRYGQVTACLLGKIEKSLYVFATKEFAEEYHIYVRKEITGDIDKTGLKIKRNYEHEFIDFCCELVSFLFYVYACDPRMSASIKMVQLMLKIMEYVNGGLVVSEVLKKYGKEAVRFREEERQRLYRRVNDELRLALFANKNRTLECMNLLMIYHGMPERFRLTDRRLEALVTDGEGRLAEGFDFLSVFTLEHLVGQIYGQSNVQVIIRKWIKEKAGNRQELTSTEAVYLLLLTLSCPHFDKDFKTEVCQLFEVKDDDAKILVEHAGDYKNMFIDWRKNKLLTMAERKRNAQVY